jgi:adenine-specific DNA-methyltransferase
MTTFNEILTQLLKRDTGFVDENGNLIRAEIINKTLKLDKDLISSLLSDKRIKEKFFSEIEGHWVFEMNKFVGYR